MKEFFIGLTSYWRAWRLAWSAHLWHLLIIPGLISLLYFPAIAFLTWRFGGRLAEYVSDNWVSESLQRWWLDMLMTIVLVSIAIYFGFLLFRNVIMILYSPVLGYLSGKTEEKARPEVPRPDPKAGMLRSAVRGISMSLLSLLLAIGFFVLCFLMQIIPILGQLGMIILLPASQMFFAGQGFMDPALERRSFGMADSFRFAWRHRGRTFGCGCGFLLLALVPAVGWFLAPTLGVIAGTLIAMETARDGQGGADLNPTNAIETTGGH